MDDEKKITLSISTFEAVSLVFALRAKIKEIYDKSYEPNCFTDAKPYETLLTTLSDIVGQMSKESDKN